MLGITSAAGNLTDTAGEWVPVELYGRTGPSQSSLGVVVRVGFYGSLARGLALFDDVSLEELPGPPPIPSDKIVKLGSAETQARIIKTELPILPARRPASRGPAGLFTPAALAVAVVILLWITILRRATPVTRRPPGGSKVSIEDLMYGQGVPAGPQKEARLVTLRGKPRQADSRMEHRRNHRSPFIAPVTLRRQRAGRIENLNLRGKNLSDGGILLVGGDPSQLRLDEKVGIDIPIGDRTVDLGKATVTRVRAPAAQRGRQLHARYGLSFLLPPSRIHRLRQELGGFGTPPVVTRPRRAVRQARPVPRRRRKGAAAKRRR